MAKAKASDPASDNRVRLQQLLLQKAALKQDFADDAESVFKEIKKTINGGSIGYWIGKEFISLNKLKNRIELIPKIYCPF